ncbi:hypothetical protein ACE6H2_020671 [Prunus campanulata]
MICRLGRMSVLPNPPLMKRPRIPFTEKTQVRVGPSSFARVKYSSTMSSADPKVDKCSPAGDACGVAEIVVDHVDAKQVADQGSPAGVSE